MPLDPEGGTYRALYRPPAPVPRSPLQALFGSLLSNRRDLLSLMPAAAYRTLLSEIGRTRRKIFLVNDPDLVRALLTRQADSFPKNDLMVGALEPLVGNSVFISSGSTWQRQRRMIDTAFSQLRVNRAFGGMAAGLAHFERHLDDLAERREAFSLEAAMSHLTADIICRTIFSVSLESRRAREVFDAFAHFQDSVANVQILRLWLGRPWAAVRQPAAVLRSAALIRRHIGDLIDARPPNDSTASRDIAGDVIAARDPKTGAGFSREELIDQIGVFFLAGHETTAGSLAWALFILSQQPEAVARMRAETEAVCGTGPIDFDSTKKLVFARAVFRETLRLYPPLAFIPRVAGRAGKIGSMTVPRGAMIMISPWIMHRHRTLWRDPDRFDPERFLPDREREWNPNAYLPFGAGPRLCIGAAFATVESILILTHLIRRYEIETLNAGEVQPVTRLTTRSARGIRVRLKRR